MPSSSILLVVDNGSSYTDDLMDLLLQDELNVRTRRMTAPEISLDALDEYGAFILSGRKQNSRLVNAVNSKIVHHAARTGTKLLGICYGAEIMALALGGAIRRSTTNQKNKLITVHITGSTPLAPAGTIEVFESHRYEISRLPPQLEVVGGSDECRYEVVQYRDQDIYGTQFHPEMSKDGHAMIRRFCAMI